MKNETHTFVTKPYQLDPNEWLSNMDLKWVSAGGHGLWIHLLHKLSDGFPYGCFSKLDSEKLFKNKDEYGLANYSEEYLRQLSTKQLHNLLNVLLPLETQLELAINEENFLSSHFDWPEEVIRQHLYELGFNRIFFRTSSGIIFNRQLVRANQKRVTAYLNRKSRVSKKLKAEESDSNNKAFSSTQVAINTPMDNEKQAYPHFDLKPYYEGGFWSAKKRWPLLARNDYNAWHQFITFLISNTIWWSVFKAKMIEPIDYATMARKRNFTPNKWKPVLERMLCAGLSSEHKLFFRLPQFIEYYEGNSK